MVPGDMTPENVSIYFFYYNFLTSFFAEKKYTFYLKRQNLIMMVGMFGYIYVN